MRVVLRCKPSIPNQTQSHLSTLMLLSVSWKIRWVEIVPTTGCPRMRRKRKTQWRSSETALKQGFTTLKETLWFLFTIQLLLKIVASRKSLNNSLRMSIKRSFSSPATVVLMKVRFSRIQSNYQLSFTLVPQRSRPSSPPRRAKSKLHLAFLLLPELKNRLSINLLGITCYRAARTEISRKRWVSSSDSRPLRLLSPSSDLIERDEN